MQRDSIEFNKVKDTIVEHGHVSFNMFDYTIRKNKGYLVPIEFYFEELIDITPFEKVIEELEKNIADFRMHHVADFDFEKALYADISAFESFYEVTVDFWFETFQEAVRIAEDLDVPSENIFDIESGQYIYEDEDD